MQRETYCTRCAVNVRIADANYAKLANGRAIIKGKCSSCGLDLIKASIAMKTSALTTTKKGGLKGSRECLFLDIGT